MKALVYSIFLQSKLDLRNKHVLSAYYLMPIIFFLVIGAVYQKVNPLSKDTLIQTMSILSVSIAAYLGTPAPLVDFFSSNSKKTYKVSNIKLYVILITTFISAIVHMLIVSMFIFITAPMIFDVNRPEHLGVYFLWLFITIIICTVIGMVIGIFSKNNSMMTMISQFVFLPTMLISGIMFPINMLPDWLQKLGNILPATYSVEIMTSLNNITSKMMFPLLGIGVISILLLFIQYKRIQVD